MGIDGGGSNLRVVVATPDLTILGESHDGTANPTVIGHAAAAEIIQQTMRQTIENANLQPADIQAVGIGVAGAAADRSTDWLCEVVGAITPHALMCPSSDVEIALVGAHGKREGVLILAGTGSVAYGVNPAGEAMLLGGWGHLLGDEGSGFWIGLAALKALAQASEHRAEPTTLAPLILEKLACHRPRDLIQWMYGQPRAAEIAQLAPLVLAQAELGDAVAMQTIDEAVQQLAGLARATLKNLNFPDAPVAFAGGLLSHENRLSRGLCAALGLPNLPISRYSPVFGGILLAAAALSGHNKE